MARFYKVENINLDEAKRCLSFDPETGEFKWKINKGRMVRAGDTAGSVHRNGYRRIGICGCVVFAHRLAWMFHYGTPPTNEIDHLNGIRDDNRISNLRDTSSVINGQNTIAKKPGKSGLVGVFSENMDDSMWSTQIGFLGKTVRVSGFASPEDAHAMFVELKKRLHDGFSHR